MTMQRPLDMSAMHVACYDRNYFWSTLQKSHGEHNLAIKFELHCSTERVSP